MELLKFKSVRWIIGIIVVLFVANGLTDKYKEIYNTSLNYNIEYSKGEQKRELFFDKMWKTYQQKSDVALLNQEAFNQVTETIFTNRKDGENVAWKWVSENQHVDYNEFTKFYSDLSTYIEGQRNEYYELENGINEIAQKNNLFLESFPNNIYNKFVGAKKIEYKKGFTSSKTKEVFKTGEENL